MRLTDMADELYAAPACSALPGGVRVATARHDGVTVTRVEIAREGLERPRGRYVTLEVPRVSVLDERDSGVIEQAAAELRALLPPEGPVLVLGVPVLAAGIPTLMEAREGKDLVVTPRELDSVIAHGAALLGSAINRALQPRLSIAQLCWLAS